MITSEMSLTEDTVGAGMIVRNPSMNEKGVMLLLGNNQLAYAKGRSSTEIGKSEQCDKCDEYSDSTPSDIA